MSPALPSRCRRCGTTVSPDAPLCPRCLLEAVSPRGGQAVEERLFEEALQQDPGERLQFLAEATRGNPQLLSAVQMLLRGYDEAGRDAGPTLGGLPAGDSGPGGEPGMLIDHFRLVRLLGEGGMGSVWCAEQLAPVRRRVALKVIKLGMDTREVVRRFERERQTLALLTHPHIAQVFEAGCTAQGRPYFAMELVEGRAITTHCREARLDVRARLALFLDVCSAVEHAHQKGIIHRDLKPSNILVSPDGVKVIDFGVARATRGSGETLDSLGTLHARIVGTPAYMSPEQAQTDGFDVDTRTDVYALGVILYELLTGTLPIPSRRLSHTSLVDLQRILREVDPPAPSTRLTRVHGARRPGEDGSAGTDPEAGHPLSDPGWTKLLRGDLDRVVMKAIRKDRNERYSGAAALADDLRRHLAGEPVSAMPPSLSYRAGKFIRRHRAAVLASASAVITLVAALAVSLVQVHRTHRALAGESKARAEATFTLADMYARSGLVAAQEGKDAEAVLWFANATILGGQDPERTSANRLRHATWSREAPSLVRAFDTGYEHLARLRWNPRHAALIVRAENEPEAQVWDLAAERPWSPAMTRKLVAAEWDPSGDRIAVSLRDGTLAVWEYPSGREQVRISAPAMGRPTWSPDGRWLAAGGLLWNWESGEHRRLPVSAEHMRFSPDGRRILLQWNTNAGIVRVDLPEQFLHPPVSSPRGDHPEFLGSSEDAYVVGMPGGGVHVHDATTGRLRETVEGNSPDRGGGQLADVSRDGRYIARVSLPVIDRQDPGARRFPIHQGHFTEVRFSPQGTRIASGGYDRRIELWSLPDGGFLGEIGRHHSAVINLEFSPDGRFLAAGEDGLVRVWRIPDTDWIREIPVGTPTLTALSPDGGRMALAGWTHRDSGLRRTRVYSIPSGEPISPELDPDGLILDAAFAPSPSTLALAVSTTPDRGNSAFLQGGGSGNLQLWDPRSGERLGAPFPLPSEPRGVSWHPSGRWIGIACAGGEGVEVEPATRELQVLFRHNRPANADGTLCNGRCAYSPDGRVFAVWGLYQFFHLWDRERGLELVDPSEPLSNTFDLAFHGSTAARAVVARRMRIDLHHLGDGTAAAPAIPYSNWPLLTRFSPDGELLLTAGGGRTAQVWEWREGRLLCPMLPHDETIMAGGFLPGTPWIVTGGHDQRVRFWDRRTGMMIRPPVPRKGWVLDLKVTPDGRTLVTSGHEDGTVGLIDLTRALPPSGEELTAEGIRVLAELEAEAEIHPGAGLARLSPPAWLQKWREFRARHPDYPGHRLPDRPEGAAEAARTGFERKPGTD